MPVRIYEIAKKVGIPSKEVLAKAKELGITNAKVASSTLDKITAEYLEEKIAGTQEPEPEPAPVAVEPVIITAPVEELEEETADETEADPEQDAAEEEEEEAEEPRKEEKEEVEEPEKEEEESTDLGKKVGFIELGNMPVRPAIRERKKKKDKKPAKAPEAKRPTTAPTAATGPPKPKFTAPANGPLIAMKPPIIVRDLAEPPCGKRVTKGPPNNRCWPARCP